MALVNNPLFARYFARFGGRNEERGNREYRKEMLAGLSGRVMEVGPAETVFAGPHHPYTEALFSAVPSLDGQRPDRIRLQGEIPSAADPPSGCVFHTRCPRRLPTGICESTEPPLIEGEPGHQIRCHIPVAELRIIQRNESAPSQGGSL